jgi:hypothetical protein
VAGLATTGTSTGVVQPRIAVRTALIPDAATTPTTMAMPSTVIGSSTLRIRSRPGNLKLQKPVSGVCSSREESSPVAISPPTIAPATSKTQAAQPCGGSLAT